MEPELKTGGRTMRADGCLLGWTSAWRGNRRSNNLSADRSQRQPASSPRFPGSRRLRRLSHSPLLSLLKWSSLALWARQWALHRGRGDKGTAGRRGRQGMRGSGSRDDR